MKVAYLRVSTEDQNLDRQRMLIANLGVEQVFEEKLSGKNTDRPELKRMLEFVRTGDTLIIESISRLARSTRDLLTIVETLQKKDVTLVSLKENFDTSTPQGKFMLTIFGALAELERETTLQRQREGIDAAKLQGKHLGRPRMVKPKNWDSVITEWKAGDIKTIDAIKETGLPRASFYKLVSIENIR